MAGSPCLWNVGFVSSTQLQYMILAISPVQHYFITSVSQFPINIAECSAPSAWTFPLACQIRNVCLALNISLLFSW